MRRGRERSGLLAVLKQVLALTRTRAAPPARPAGFRCLGRERCGTARGEDPSRAGRGDAARAPGADGAAWPCGTCASNWYGVATPVAAQVGPAREDAS